MLERNHSDSELLEFCSILIHSITGLTLSHETGDTFVSGQ